MAYDAERGVDRGQESVGRRQLTSGMHGERARLWRLGGDRAFAERTWNISRMFVTLDVSKLSGWLNVPPPFDSADCVEVQPAAEFRHDQRHKLGADV